MRGWFDAFRSDGGPTLYSTSNRTPVTGDVPTITLCVVFFTLFIAFLVIFPGVRKERFTTFTSVTLSLFVGTVILVCNYGSDWHIAETHISSSYRAFSREKILGDIGVYVGLKHVNVTLTGVSNLPSFALFYPSFSGEPLNITQTEDIDYNERFYWEGPTEVQEEFRAALVKGLPYPILTVVEYFSLDEEGFSWGRHYRSAGYYGSILLWTCFASWMLMNLLLVVVPRYGAYMMTLTGALMLTTNLLYYILLPKRPLVIRFEEKLLHFRFGWCYWLILVAGILCLIVGLIIAIMDMIYPHKFSTILEVDYDTPYDRHIIIEESHFTRKKKNKPPRLEEPPSAGLGSRLLRLSKREKLDDRHGLDNEAFEMDPPKSPWRYPHLMLRSDFGRKPSPKSVSFRRQSRTDNGLSLSHGNGTQAPLSLPPHLSRDPLHTLNRADSKGSSMSSDSASSLPRLDSLTIQMHPPQVTDMKGPIQRQDSQQSAGSSSLSSFGLSFLSRANSRKEPASFVKAAKEAVLGRQMHQLHVDPGSHRPLGRSASARDSSAVSVDSAPGTKILRRNSGENLREMAMW